MKTMNDIHARADEIKSRLSDIFEELRDANNPHEKAMELAEEIGLLLREQTILQCNIRHHNIMTQKLLESECSGPH